MALPLLTPGGWWIELNESTDLAHAADLCPILPWFPGTSTPQFELAHSAQSPFAHPSRMQSSMEPWRSPLRRPTSPPRPLRRPNRGRLLIGKGQIVSACHPVVVYQPHMPWGQTLVTCMGITRKLQCLAWPPISDCSDHLFRWWRVEAGNAVWGTAMPSKRPSAPLRVRVIIGSEHGPKNGIHHFGGPLANGVSHRRAWQLLQPRRWASPPTPHAGGMVTLPLAALLDQCMRPSSALRPFFGLLEVERSGQWLLCSCNLKTMCTSDAKASERWSSWVSATRTKQCHPFAHAFHCQALCTNSSWLALGTGPKEAHSGRPAMVS